MPPKVILLLAGLLVTAALVYGRGADGPWLFDDTPNLLENSLVQIHGGRFDEWRAAAVSSHSGPLRRPLAMLSFAANYAFVGEFSVVAVKVTNILLHCAIGVLVYLLGHAILGALDGSGERASTRRAVALLAAALWLLHPLHVSTVLYAVQRMAQMSTFFVLLGLWVFVRRRRLWAERGGAAGEVLSLALWLGLLTALATLSKENGALLPWLVVVVEVSVFRGRWNGTPHPGVIRLGWLLLVAPLALLALLLLVSPDSLLSGYARREFTLEQRLLTQARLLWQYLGWLVVPDIDQMGLHHDDIPWSSGILQPITTGLSIVCWVAALGFSLALRKRFPLVLFTLLFYLVGHSMESGVLPLEMVFEHRNYLPSFGVCLLGAWLIVGLAQRSGRVSPGFVACSVTVLLLPFLLIRVMTWSDELRLAQVNMVNHPGSVRAHHMYANTLLRRHNALKLTERGSESSRELLVLARQQYEDLQAQAATSLPTLVMLHQTDSTYFPELGQRADWVGQIESQLSYRVLQATDLSALKTLMNCLGSGSCPADPSASDRILKLLRQRFTGWYQIYLLEYEYLKAADADYERRIEILERGLKANPGTTRFYYPLIDEYFQSGDLAGLYEAARGILAADPNRRRLPAVAHIFAGPGGASP